MTLTYHKAEPVFLSDEGFDEKWLHEIIVNDPSILGLGEINVLKHERKQSSGGRIDFLMHDPEIDMMYEIEVMIGRLNESHIIRTIEYWDIEKRRWMNREHRAVIIAEEITNRFFNVIALFNRAIPIIAIQLNALKIDEKIILNFTKVLDIYESPEIDDGPEIDIVDRKYWDIHNNPESMKIVDQLIRLATVDNKSPRINYRRSDIALGGSKKHFCWLNPRKSKPRCLVYLKVLESDIQTILDSLEDVKINAHRNKDDVISIKITPDDLKNGESVLHNILADSIKNIGGEIE